MLVFDIESDGLLNTISKLHCINAIDRATGREYRFTDHEYYQNVDGSTSDVKCPRDGDISDGLRALQEAEVIGGHHIIGYDLPAIQIVYPEIPIQTQSVDSMVYAQIVHPDLKDKDWSMIRKGKLPQDFKKHAGSNKLLHWGIRLGGEAKSDFKPSDYGHTWATMPFIQDMDEYCMQDVRANVTLFEHLESKETDPRCVDLEMRVAEIITWQERTGVRFDVDAAKELARDLYARQIELREEARQVFPPFYLKDGKPKTFKKAMKRKSKAGEWKEWISAGAEHQPVKLVEFNPGSSQHIERSLRRKYNWEPTEFTDTGLAKIDEEILDALPYPEAKKIATYKMVTKRLSQLCEGKQAWMKKVKKDGRIYGRVNQLGTVTGRMSHFGPNLAQVPKVGKPYGSECRALFVSDTDRTIVGCDADALELRVLAHFMARFDGGAYIETVLNGSKEDGTDMHTRNQLAIGLDSRDVAKTYFYAMLYGSGNFNLGTIVMTDWSEEKLTRFYEKFPPGRKRQSKIAAIGKRSREKLMTGLPALARLVDKVGQAAKRGYLKGLDGRRIPVRSAHAALNALCQSAGAVIMKQALVLMFESFERNNLDVLPLLNIHDEVQLSTTRKEAQDVGRIAARSIREAGEHFNFRCPLAGDYEVGGSWRDTH